MNTTLEVPIETDGSKFGVATKYRRKICQESDQERTGYLGAKHAEPEEAGRLALQCENGIVRPCHTKYSK